GHGLEGGAFLVDDDLLLLDRERELHDLGALLGRLLMRVHEGGATSSTFWRGSFRSSAALVVTGVASSSAAAATLNSAPLRVNIGWLLAFAYRRTLLLSPLPNLRCNKDRREWKQTKE